MPVILTDGGQYSITGSANDDLRFGSVRSRGSFAYPSWWGLHDDLIGPGISVSGKPISYTKIFKTQPVVGAAVNRLLTWAARVPLKVYERTDDNDRRRLRPGEHPLATAINTPWQRAGQLQLVLNTLGPLLIHGNATIQVDSGAGDALFFRPRDWRYLTPIQPFRNEISGWESAEEDEIEVVTAGQMLHVFWWSPTDPCGVSPLQQLGTTVSIEQMAQDYALHNLANMARPPFAVTVSEAFLGFDRAKRDSIMEQMRDQIVDVYSGPESAGKPFILPTGLDTKPMGGQSAVEAELIKQRQVNGLEVAGVYQIPPMLMGIMDNANYSNMETARNMAYTDSLGPYLVLIESAINSQIAQALLGLDDIYCEFDFAQVLRGDRLKEMQAFREAIGTGVMTPNEARTAINLPRSDAPQADELLVPTNNLQPISQIGKETDSNED